MEGSSAPMTQVNSEESIEVEIKVKKIVSALQSSTDSVDSQEVYHKKRMESPSIRQYALMMNKPLGLEF